MVQNPIDIPPGWNGNVATIKAVSEPHRILPVTVAFSTRLKGEVRARAPSVSVQELADPPGEALDNGLMA